MQSRWHTQFSQEYLNKDKRLNIIAPLSQDFHMLEFFAGRARVTEEFRRAGYLTAKFDVLYNTAKPGKSNFMDLTESSGFLLL